MNGSVSATPITNIMLDGPLLADTRRGAVALEVSAPMTRFSVPLRVVVVPLRNRAKEVVAHALIDAEDADWVNQWIWCMSGNGYAWRSSYREDDKATHTYLHRELAGCTKDDGLIVDHINRDRLDNRRANLRVGTQAEGAQNKPAIRGRYRGVSWDSGRRKWIAYAQLDRRNHFLGRFDREEDAARVVAEWRREHMPFSEEAAS